MVDEIQQRPIAMAEVRPFIGANQARVNITWKGNNADLPDPVPYDATEGDVKQWVTEAVRAGIPGIPADPTADFRDFVVDRFAANDVTPYNRLMIRPKTPFGVRPDISVHYEPGFGFIPEWPSPDCICPKTSAGRWRTRDDACLVHGRRKA